MPEQVLLTMRGICKYFPGVKALENVDFTLKTGEIHALMGENGAGKSTLIKVLTGVYPLDAGEIIMCGRPIKPSSPLEAQKENISTVYQEVNLCPNLSVAENIFIGREPSKLGMIDWKTINKRAKDLLTRLNLNIDVTKTLDNFSVAVQQMIAIARAVDVSAKVLILDEPTSSLDEAETQHLFSVVRKLKKEGLGIIFVSHFLDQIYELCDRVTVLRNGELVGAYDIEKLPRVELISKMIGKELGDIQSVSKGQADSSSEIYLEAQDITAFGRTRNFELKIHKGEVVGFAGLLGSGRTETAEILFGVAKPDTGSIRINSETVKFSGPSDAMKQKIAFCPEDRKAQGIVGELSVRENIILALQAKKGVWNHISLKEQEKITDEYIKLLQIKVSSQEQLIKNLSGGNQQKVIIARWLATNPELLILDEPTRGIDIGTKTEVQKMVIQLAKEKNMSIVFISSEIDEMIRTCTRLAVLRDRRKIAELTGDKVNSDYIMETIAGGVAQ
jgi:simple sugar transport system ATP-binding protein